MHVIIAKLSTARIKSGRSLVLDTAGVKRMIEEIAGVLFDCIVLGCLGFFTQPGGFPPTTETIPLLYMLLTSTQSYALQGNPRFCRTKTRGTALFRPSEHI